VMSGVEGIMAPAVGVVVLTYNEELNIERCLDSVAWCDDVVVLDSHSVDRTTAIARERGARVLTRRFDDYAGQRNYALKQIEYKHPWVLMLDADEVVPPELSREMVKVVATAGEHITMFRMRRKDFFLGRWLRYSTSYSTLWFGRLVRVGRVWVERSVNEEYHTDGEVVALKGALEHYPFNRGFREWFEKHNRYSSMEAELRYRQGVGRWQWRDFRDPDPVIRRKVLKAVVYSLPARPLVMFGGRYFIHGGMLDGRAGLTFCLLKSVYEYMIDCKVTELHRRQQGMTV